MQATRWEILQTLKKRGQATVGDLAEAIDLAPITIRHHLAILEREGLVTRHRERSGVGRPRHVFRLTAAAEELFPKKYHVLAERLLDELKSMANPQQVVTIFKRMAEEITHSRNAVSEDAPIEEQLEALVQLLGEEGFLARWRCLGREYELTEYSCPYFYVGQKHPEICQFDLQIINSALDAAVERTACRAHGDEFCSYRIVPIMPA